MHAFQSAEVGFSSPATSASTVAGAGLSRYAATASTSAAFHPPFLRPSPSLRPSTSRTTRSRASPKRLPALHSATASSPDVSSALTSSIASGAK